MSLKLRTQIKNTHLLTFWLIRYYFHFNLIKINNKAILAPTISNNKSLELHPILKCFKLSGPTITFIKLLIFHFQIHQVAISSYQKRSKINTIVSRLSCMSTCHAITHHSSVMANKTVMMKMKKTSALIQLKVTITNYSNHLKIVNSHMLRPYISQLKVSYCPRCQYFPITYLWAITSMKQTSRKKS
jgi:hypothetical protein